MISSVLTREGEGRKITKDLNIFLSRQLLTTICGVSGSNKLCTRSLRCPAHTDFQRREVRLKWLGGKHEDEIDVDSDGDTIALRDSLSQLSNASRLMS